MTVYVTDDEEENEKVQKSKEDVVLCFVSLFAGQPRSSCLSLNLSTVYIYFWYFTRISLNDFSRFWMFFSFLPSVWRPKSFLIFLNSLTLGSMTANLDCINSPLIVGAEVCLKSFSYCRMQSSGNVFAKYCKRIWLRRRQSCADY